MHMLRVFLKCAVADAGVSVVFAYAACFVNVC